MNNIVLPAWVKTTDDQDPSLIAGYGDEHVEQGVGAQLYSYFEAGEENEAPGVQILFRGRQLQESLEHPSPDELRLLAAALTAVALELEAADVEVS